VLVIVPGVGEDPVGRAHPRMVHDSERQSFRHAEGERWNSPDRKLSGAQLRRARNPAIIRAIAQQEWDVLICDEAHKMKNIDALTTRAVLGNTRGEYQHGDIKMPAIAKHCRHTSR
jgi:hypothetical protein